jgi:hypothetical protein
MLVRDFLLSSPLERTGEAAAGRGNWYACNALDDSVVIQLYNNAIRKSTLCGTAQSEKQKGPGFRS